MKKLLLLMFSVWSCYANSQILDIPDRSINLGYGKLNYYLLENPNEDTNFISISKSKDFGRNYMIYSTFMIPTDLSNFGVKFKFDFVMYLLEKITRFQPYIGITPFSAELPTFRYITPCTGVTCGFSFYISNRVALDFNAGTEVGIYNFRRENADGYLSTNYQVGIKWLYYSKKSRKNK